MTNNNEYPLAEKMVITLDQLDKLIRELGDQKYTVNGPTVRDNAVTYNPISSAEQLPKGWSDEQDGGRYRLVKSDRPAYFDCVVGQHSWKSIFYPAQHNLFTAKKTERSFELIPSDNGASRLALLGVRACELKALAIHDQILIKGEYDDPYYRKLREDALIVAVNCVRPGGTCFCASVGTGPKATEGFDLALTEVFADGNHSFVVEKGSRRGEKLAELVGAKTATQNDLAAAERALQQSAMSMGRHLETGQLKERLLAAFDDPHWNEIAERCLTCGNCTMVCPTCFCVNIEDATDLTSSKATRERRWDSCFSVNFAYIHGGSIRPSAYARYRQWLMHKLVHWQDQFGVLGCVGCGRCITWCPVGIDITEEARTLTADS
jgi:sulfhydrogenase subunit beta (sulfur reductase)